MQPLKEDIEWMRGKQESLAFWQRRQRFLIVHWNKFPLKDLTNLSYCYSSVMVYSCRYPQVMMDKLYELALEVADNFHKEEESKALSLEIRQKWNEAMTEPETLGRIKLQEREEETGESADDEGDAVDGTGCTVDYGQSNKEKVPNNYYENEKSLLKIPLMDQHSQKLLPENLSKVQYSSNQILPLARSGLLQKVLHNQLKSPPICGPNIPLTCRDTVNTSNQLPKEESSVPREQECCKLCSKHDVPTSHLQLSLLQQQKSFLQKSSPKFQQSLDVKEKHHNRKSNDLLGTGSTHLSEVKRSSGVEEKRHQMHSDLNKQLYSAKSHKDMRSKKNELVPFKSSHPPPSKSRAVEQKMQEAQCEGEPRRKRASSTDKKDNLLTRFPSKVEHFEKISTTKTNVVRKSKQEDFGRKDKSVNHQEQTTPYDKATSSGRKKHGTCHKSVRKLCNSSHVLSKDDTTTNIRSESRRKDVREFSTPKCVTLHSQGQIGGAFYRKEGIKSHIQGQTGNGFFKKVGAQTHVQGQSKGGFSTKEGVQTLTRGNYPSSKSFHNVAASTGSGVVEQRKASDSRESNTEGPPKKTRVIYPSHSSKTSSLSTRNKMDVKNGDQIIKPAPGSFSKSHIPKPQENPLKPKQAEHGSRSLHGPTAYKSNKFPLKNFFQGLFQKARSSFDC